MSDSSTAARAALLAGSRIYPERADRPDGWKERLDTVISGIPPVLVPGFYAARNKHILRRAARIAAKLEAMNDRAIEGFAQELRRELRRVKFTGDAVARSFALVREVANRTIGLRHYDVQLLGGFAMLKGMVAEMETGEGKTLTATLPACTAAMAGIPVHIITVNDYLAQRDAETMGPIYRALGLTVDHVIHGKSPEDRRSAYLSDVTYCTNKEAAFDYLRDRLVLGSDPSNLRLKIERLYGETSRTNRLVMRGLHFAIVDEADSILIDEARTPLIISSESDPADEEKLARQALKLVETLDEQRDYSILLDERRIELTDAGKQRLAQLAESADGVWLGRIRREHAAAQALAAKHLFRRDDHYLVRDGKIEIIDEYTGRVMTDRSWGEGLHQLIEVKEGCMATPRKDPLARMTYQRFFRRYQRLSGMTGTARETAGELWSVYRLPVVTVPPNKPLRRTRRRDRICRTIDDKWTAIAARAKDLAERGQPVLLGTRSVAASEAASRQFDKAGLPHVVLNAAQDRHEAEVIAEAGQRGRVTIATNMAGRGVDIELDGGVAELGGLCVLMSERHDAGRIDRQLLGRSGRHGEPGSAEAILSLEDPLLEYSPGRLLLAIARIPGWIGQWAARAAFDRAQSNAERKHSRMRRELVKLDQRLGNLLAFSGRNE
jgi:preprotein translocase subunit SecA